MNKTIYIKEGMLGECGRDDCTERRFLANRCRKHYVVERRTCGFGNMFET